MSDDHKTVSATDETVEAPVSGTDATVTPTSRAGDTLGATAGGAARPTAELHNLNPGDVIERYEIKAVLGAGGMGRVYRALDPDLHRELAIKVLRRTGSNLEHRLLREAQAMARLKHANLATVYDVGTVRGQVFIAFEFIDGQTLAAWSKSGPRTINERLAALTAAGRGLAAAHAAGVIHRDFKPDNVLVAKDGDVKVVDFGLARGVDSEPEEAGATAPAPAGDALAKDLTVTGSLLGTPAYMAPEQHKGLHSDARADQFGFAVSAWEVLYGQRPFRGESLESLARAICAGTIEAPPASNVPSHVEAVLRRALSTDPASRYRDMTELLAALAQPTAKRSPANRRWLIGAAFGLVAVGGGLAVMKSRKSGDQATSDGDVDKQEIRAVIKKNIDGVSDCYQKAVDADASIGAGQVKIDFEIAPTGRVVSTRILNDDFKGKGGVGACIAAKSFEWKFPPPRGGGNAHVTYPFDFRPASIADAGVAEDDGRVHVVIGNFGGDAMTDEIRARSRPKLAETLGKLAPDLSVDITPGPVADQAGAHHRAFLFDIDLTNLDVTGDKVVRCLIRATLFTYPDKKGITMATSKATAELDTSALKEMTAGGADCIDASLKMIIEKEMLPNLRQQVGSAQ